CEGSTSTVASGGSQQLCFPGTTFNGTRGRCERTPENGKCDGSKPLEVSMDPANNICHGGAWVGGCDLDGSGGGVGYQNGGCTTPPTGSPPSCPSGYTLSGGSCRGTVHWCAMNGLYQVA